MVKVRRAEQERLLTEVELELMRILWRLGEGGVQDVLDALPPERDLARTSVSTILRILKAKRVLATRNSGRAHVYVPTLSKEAYETRSLQHIVSEVFDGKPASLVLRLIDTQDLDTEELAAIRALLKKRGALR